MNLSILIPTYNGLHLLQKNLNSVLNSMSQDDELIIVDDHSSDDTIKWLKDRFKLKKKKSQNHKQIWMSAFNYHHIKLKIKVIQNHKNLRFARSVNQAVSLVSHDYFFLINNDVKLKKNTISLLKKKIKSIHQGKISQVDSKNLFAISCHEISQHNNHQSEHGKNVLYFKKGLYRHRKADNFESGLTAWACGGSSVFNKEKWLELRGFDSHYQPAYWEDIDLSFRARKKGWCIYFAKKIEVFHNHESTSKQEFGEKKIKRKSFKNALLFTLKNTDFRRKLLFCLNLPLNILKFWNDYDKVKLHLVLLLLSSFLLRFLFLGEIPQGMTWDEAAIGYNGWSIINYRRDEWLNFLPVSFKSFGDFKAPLAIYLNGLFTTILGLNLFAVRLPFALSGVMAVISIYFLTLSILKNLETQKKLSFIPIVKYKKNIAFFTALSLCLSPWHLHFTRTGFESGLALTQVILGLLFLFKFFNLDNKSKFWQENLSLFAAIIFFASSLYTYHSSKIFLPLLFLSLFVSFFKQCLKALKKIWPPFLFILTQIPLLRDSLYGEGLTRAGSLVFSQEKNVFKLIKIIASNLYQQLSLSFLIFGQTDNFRHGSGRFGVIFLTEFILILGLLIILFYQMMKSKAKSKVKQVYLLISVLLFMTLIGFTPAILGQTVPHANRSLFALLPLSLIIGISWQLLFFYRKKIATFILIIHLGLFSVYLHYYFTELPKKWSYDYQEGYKQVFDYLEKISQKEEYSNKDIKFSNQAGQAYIYALFFKKVDPISYNHGALRRFIFVDKISESDRFNQKKILVATHKDKIDDNKADKIIYNKNDQVLFKIYLNE